MHSLFKSIKQVYKSNRFVRPVKGKKARKTQSKLTIYVVRINMGNCMPCNHCQGWLAAYGVKKVKYTDIVNGEQVLCELRLKN